MQAERNAHCATLSGDRRIGMHDARAALRRGTAADHAMSNAVAEKFSPQGARFAAYVAFYPWCGEQIFWQRKTGAPMLFLLAKKDDWVSAEGCSSRIKRRTLPKNVFMDPVGKAGRLISQRPVAPSCESRSRR